MGLAGLVHDLGQDPYPIFAALGFHPRQFLDPDLEISFVPGSRLLERCATATNCRHLGLLLGERTEPSSLGIVGFMLQSAPDVGTALRGLVRHLDLHDQGAVATLTTDARMTRLGYAIHVSEVAGSEQIYDLSMSVVCTIMRSLCGTGWNPAAVHLPRRPPPDPAPYRRIFRAPLRFNADKCALRFASRWLGHPIRGADPLLHRHLEREAERLHADRRHKDLLSELRGLLRTSLATHGGRADDIARRLGMHERTLNRRLRQANTSFRRQLEDIRYGVARQLLADTEMPQSKIATALGYADSTVFIRAFKRWSGIPPAQWRRLHQRI